MGIMVEASALSAADATKLTSLLQSSHASGDEDSDSDSDLELGAPDPAVYKFSGGGIIDALQNLLEKAQDQLTELRKKEQEAIHVFELLKLSLSKQIEAAQ